MSTLKSAKELPAVDELLPAEEAHVASYWTAIEPHLGDHGSAANMRTPVEAFTGEIRRRVSDVLETADGDTDDAVESLRNIYREVKTRSVDTCVDGLVDAAAALT